MSACGPHPGGTRQSAPAASAQGRPSRVTLHPPGPSIGVKTDPAGLWARIRRADLPSPIRFNTSRTRARSSFRVGNTDGAPVFGMRNSYSLTTYPGRIVVIPQIATTATSRPEALTSCSMSSGSLVRIVAFCRRAVVTTTASTTSDVLVMPNSRPASCASVSPRGTTTHPVKKRRSWACCGDRLTWTTTGAGTNGTTPSSKRALCSAHARRWFLSAATRTAAS